MNAPNEEGKKIPFFFTPIPKAFFEPDFFNDADLFRFACFAINCTAFETTAFLSQGSKVILEPGEFIFGRPQWVKLTGISEMRLRRITNQLTIQHFIQKITSKTTSKITVYKWVWGQIFNSSNQQNILKTTSKSSAKQPHIKNIDIRIEKQQQQKVLKTRSTLQSEDSPDRAAAFPRLIGKAKKMFCALTEEKREAIIALYHTRSKNQPIENPDAWFIKCMEEDWLKEEKLDLPLAKVELSCIELNRQFAIELIHKFESLPGLHICLRNDFLELGNMESPPWQIFLCEAAKAFEGQVRYAFKKLGLHDCSEKLS